MSEFLFFIIGLLIGGCLGIVVISVLQIDRICEYESQIRKLKSQITKDQKSETLNK